MSNSSANTGTKRRKKYWSKGMKWLLGALGTVLIALIISVSTTAINRVISDAGAKKPAPVNVRVVDNSVCNFVAPLSNALMKDPTKLEIKPLELGGGSSCGKALKKVHGARIDISLEAVLAPSGDAAIVFTDVTIHVLKSSPVGNSAFYSPAGTGGGGLTLSIGADVEKKTAVREVDVYAEDGTMKTYNSVLAVRPRPTATKADPLIVDIDLYGDRNYTTFDVDLHWQSSTSSGFVRLDNGGAGYMVGGSGGLPNFRGTDGDRWEPGSN